MDFEKYFGSRKLNVHNKMYYFRLGTCFLFLALGQLCSSASIKQTTELPLSSYRNVVEHFRKVFLEFPCSNKLIVNQLFDIYIKFADLDQGENILIDATAEMKRLTVIGNGLNVSPKEWKSAQPADELSAEEKVNNFMTKFQLTPIQIERLRIVYPKDQPYGELQLYLDNFPLGVALGIPEEKIKRILDKDKHEITDFSSRVAVSKRASEELGDFAEETCDREYLSPGQYTKKANIVRDFLQAIDDLKVDSSEK